jgi:monoamine oxidase
MLKSVIIIGGGLSGVLCARLLHQAGVDFTLLEMRGRLGGRILSAAENGEPGDGGFDLGPSWFWPSVQSGLAALVAELGLTMFPQYSEGDVLFERMVEEKPHRYRMESQEQRSMRLAGGTGALIAALKAQVPADRIILNAAVTKLALTLPQVTVWFGHGSQSILQADHVILAAPPRLMADAIVFEPALASADRHLWQATPTWMAPHAKFFAAYQRPFWREAGLSGMAQSLVGPMGEIHDATTHSGKAALFGFVGIGATERSAISQEQLVAACLRQLTRLFGPGAAKPQATLWKDWAADPATATAEDKIAGEHPQAVPQPWVSGAWRNFLTLAASETALREPGYLAGAVEAAMRASAQVLHKRQG